MLLRLYPKNYSFINFLQAGSLIVEGQATFKDLAFFEDKVQFDSEVNVLGYSNVQALTVNLDLIVKGAIVVEGEATFKQVVKFEKDVEFNGNVSLNGGLKAGEDVAGKAIIVKGETSIKVEFKKPKSTIPIVTLSLGNGKFAQYSYRDVTEDSFEIILATPASEDLEFSWVAIETRVKDE